MRKDNRQEIVLDELDSNAVIEKRKKVRELAKFNKIKRKLFLLGVLIGLVIIIIIYFIRPISNVSKINVEGNHYLSDDYILNLANINDNSSYVLVFDFLVEKELTKDKLIESSDVYHGKDNVININVVEKQPVGYIYDSNLKIVLTDGTIITDDEYVDLIAELPLINGFDDENVKLISKSFEKVDPYIIESMSEIQRYSQSYDLNMMQILMRDGNYVFVSIYSMDVLNQYFDISFKLNEKNVCIFIEDISKNAYKSSCPWFEETGEGETTNDENSITN